MATRTDTEIRELDREAGRELVDEAHPLGNVVDGTPKVNGVGPYGRGEIISRWRLSRVRWKAGRESARSARRTARATLLAG